MNTRIHPTAIIEQGAQIGTGVTIGPYCHIGPQVRLGDGTKLHAHVVIANRTEIGEECEIFPFASLGHIPQDLKYQGEDSSLIIGKKTVIREYVSAHPGTQGGGMVTKIGDECLLMASVHVAHDCIVGNKVIMANYAGLAGHVIIDDHVTIGGLSGIHQFVQIGAHAFIGAGSVVVQDVIPFGMVTTENRNSHLSGLNIVGLKRRGFSREEIHALRAAYRFLFEGGQQSFTDRLTKLSNTPEHPACVKDMIAFLQRDSDRKILKTQGK